MQQQEPQGPQAQKRSWLEDQTSLPSRVPILEPRGLKKPEDAEGAALAPAPAFHSAIVPGFHGTPGCFCKLPHLWSSLLLSLQARFSQPASGPSRGHAPNPSFQHPAAPKDRRQATQPGMHGAAAQTRRVRPAPTDHLWQPHLIPGRSLSVPADFPTMRVFFFPVRGPPSTFSFLPKLLVPFVASLVFLSFFHPTRFQGDFSYPFRCPMSSTNVQQGLCENCSIKVYS